jgi:hypothetical protein
MADDTGPQTPGVIERALQRSVLFVCIAVLLGMSNPAQSEGGLASEQVALIVDTAVGAFKTHYVNPETGLEIESYVRARLERGEYNTFSTNADLTRQLRKDFRAVANDRHIWIDVMENILITDSGASEEEIRREKQKTNFGFWDVQMLRGNIALLRFDRFDELKYGEEAAADALAGLAGGEVVILDLRENHGGHSSMVRFICSHFFQKRTQLNSLYFVEADSLVESWSDPTVASTPLFEHPLFILTSSSTASGAESFAYTMKHYGRATLVGERTRGAAYWKETYTFPEAGMFLEIPVARPISPVTGRGWEGTGVEPDFEVPADGALARALELIADVHDW